MSYKSIIVGLFVLVGTRTGFGQFVDIRIDLSTYSELKIVGESNPKVKSNVPLQWLSISLQENIELCVEVKFRKLQDNEKRVDMKFLNNNSADFSTALAVVGNYLVMPVCTNHRPEDGGKVRDQKFTAWIGFPAHQISELIIQYN